MEAVTDCGKLSRIKLNSFWLLNLIHLNLRWKGLGYLGQLFSSAKLTAIKCHDSAIADYVETPNDCPDKAKGDLNHW